MDCVVLAEVRWLLLAFFAATATVLINLMLWGYWRFLCVADTEFDTLTAWHVGRGARSGDLQLILPVFECDELKCEEHVVYLRWQSCGLLSCYVFDLFVCLWVSAKPTAYARACTVEAFSSQLQLLVFCSWFIVYVAWMDNIKTWTGLPVEESVRMTEDRDKWRKYVHGVANCWIEDGYRTEQIYCRNTTV